MEEKKPKLIEIIPIGGKDPISIEVTEVEGESSVVQARSLSFEEMLKRINPFCEAILSAFQTLSVKPNNASAEFGLKVSMGGNLFIVKASGEAALKVTLTWSI